MAELRIRMPCLLYLLQVNKTTLRQPCLLDKAPQEANPLSLVTYRGENKQFKVLISWFLVNQFLNYRFNLKV